MTLLLDTHVLLWWLADDPRLSDPMRAAINDPRTPVAVSAVSAWEMAIKSALGKLWVPEGLSGELDGAGFDELAVTVEDGLAAGALPRHHDDPFDRMLIAQARRRGLILLTDDPAFRSYDVQLFSQA